MSEGPLLPSDSASASTLPPNLNPSPSRWGEPAPSDGTVSSSAIAVDAAFSGRGKKTDRFLECILPCLFPDVENNEEELFELEGESELIEMDGTRRCAGANDGDEGDSGGL